MRLASVRSLQSLASLLLQAGPVPRRRNRRLSPVRFLPPPSPRWKAFSSARRKRIRPSRSPSFPNEQGPLQLPGGSARAGPLHDLDPRDRLQARRPEERRRRGRHDRHRRSQAQPGQESRHAIVERRMAQQPAGRAQAEGIPDHVRRLPHPAAGADVDAQPGRIRAGVPAHVALFAGLDPDPSATAAAGPARRAPRRHRRRRQGRGGISREPHPRQCRGDRIPVQAAAASEGPRHPRHRHRIRPAAQRGDAA